MIDFTSPTGLALGLHIHWIFVTALIVGAILLVIYGVKHLGKNELKNWALWLLVIGIVGTLLTSGWNFQAWLKFFSLF